MLLRVLFRSWCDCSLQLNIQTGRAGCKPELGGGQRWSAQGATSLLHSELRMRAMGLIHSELRMRATDQRARGTVHSVLAVPCRLPKECCLRCTYSPRLFLAQSSQLPAPQVLCIMTTTGRGPVPCRNTDVLLFRALMYSVVNCKQAQAPGQATQSRYIEADGFCLQGTETPNASIPLTTQLHIKESVCARPHPLLEKMEATLSC